MNLTRINNQITAAEKKHHRPEGSVQLLAVTKTRTPEEIRQVYQAGQTQFGESYVQEALEKQAQLKDSTATRLAQKAE